MQHIYIKIAGVLNLFAALTHLIAGQIDLVNPLLNSNLGTQQKGEFVGAWHMITIFLFFSSYLIIKAGLKSVEEDQIQQLKTIANCYILFGIPFIVVSIWYGIFAPQWVLLMPIGILLHIGFRKLTI